MQPKASKPLNIRLDARIWDRIETFRFKRRFATRTEAIEFLLDYALKANPARESEPKAERER